MTVPMDPSTPTQPNGTDRAHIPDRESTPAPAGGSSSTRGNPSTSSSHDASAAATPPPAPTKRSDRTEAEVLIDAANAHGRQDALSLPKDAKMVSLVLQALGVDEYEPRVVPQLLEFMHRYVLDVLGDARTYADHANHTQINTNDIRLAIEGRSVHSFTGPPRREILESMAAKRNAIPLPLIPEKYGVRLPPERHTLTGTNFQVVVQKSKTKPPPLRAAPPDQQQQAFTHDDQQHQPMDISQPPPVLPSATMPSLPPPAQVSQQPLPGLPGLPAMETKAAGDEDDYDEE
ncbi:transcription initiation factor IID, 31kD subunit-domain-containing protein [Fimicolochytrium jonesii]|uniref:transcription initiation factor IID, 31kD subunit-domain-containing protein n=1 Tax=Fimicolochytrium jonesii TaxID=1396493 RepID=UPI0022FE1508|nr:transcription initiation factor IID, 31kD subunit-domain-containing protein [Fimicolochytrium jonesii]KAI8816852.1 transcription initiation factor IID, 31kD subunit-domain-containing protein [Fimicolochytrium jonesii]